MGLRIGRQLPRGLASSDARSQKNSESPVKTQSQEHLPSPIKSLRQLAEAEQSCTRCPLYREATQAVHGEGLNHAPFMLIGEQPGDKEDIAGKPFVGPAGRVLIRRYRTQALGERRRS